MGNQCKPCNEHEPAADKYYVPKDPGHFKLAKDPLFKNQQLSKAKER